MTEWKISETGLLTVEKNGRALGEPSPLGLVLKDKTVYAPEKATVTENTVTLTYPVGEAVLRIADCGGYKKLTLEKISDGIEHFVFGLYRTEATEYGEMLGAAWYDDGSVFCIQSLMPKVTGGFSERVSENKSGFLLPGIPDEQAAFDLAGMFGGEAACLLDGKVSLLCTVSDMSFEKKMDLLGMRNVIAGAVNGLDGKMEGGAVALMTADNAEELLSLIGKMEISEGLPHPCIDGSWAKTDKRTSGLYFVVGGEELSDEEKIEMARRAGSTCIYFSDPFESWGHFEINKELYPGGSEAFAAFVGAAKEKGVNTGFHTLSNFIHTHDPYVSPLPHEKLLVMDKTTLAKDVSPSDTEIFVTDKNNFSRRTTLNDLRIGDELLSFAGFDEERLCLTGCERGLYGTAESAYKAGDEVKRLWDHGYGTLFPDIDLQNEMADRIGDRIRETGIMRMSLDGIEGCAYTGRGEYACSEFARRVYEKAGNDLICDASRCSHYRWHMHSYFNWGEPWYDEERRGGMLECRADHIRFFKRNLLPGMLGWFCLYLNSGRYEATSPQTMEFILSRMAAFQAGLALAVSGAFLKGHGLSEQYLGMTRLWEDFRMNAELPDELRGKMKDERSDWHLEKTEKGWTLSELSLHTRHLDYCEQKAMMESGTTGYVGSGNTAAGEKMLHASNIIIDRPHDGKPAPLHFRIRVGEPGMGRLENPVFSGGYYAADPILGFSLTAEGGDYLVYDGGMEILHYDKNYNLLETVKGEGTPLVLGGDMSSFTLRYLTPADDKAPYTFTTIRTIGRYEIEEK